MSKTQSTRVAKDAAPDLELTLRMVQSFDQNMQHWALEEGRFAAAVRKVLRFKRDGAPPEELDRVTRVFMEAFYKAASAPDDECVAAGNGMVSINIDTGAILRRIAKIEAARKCGKSREAV